jgi:hypothetical protein
MASLQTPEEAIQHYGGRRLTGTTQLLLQRNNVDPNQQSGGLTLLMVAAWSGHEAVVRLLFGHEEVKPDIHAALWLDCADICGAQWA